MKVVPIPAFKDNYIWLIVNQKNLSAVCIDPGDAKPVLAYLAKHGLTLEAILLTHHHYDHTGGVAELYASIPDLAIYAPNDLRIPLATHFLQGGDTVAFSAFTLEVLATPGHTTSHISFYEPNFGWLFCGDTLFSAGCGRVFDGTIAELYASLRQLKALPDTTKVYCAHEYTQANLRFAAKVEPENLAIYQYAKSIQNNTCTLPSSIALEKQINPFFRSEIKTVGDYSKQRGAENGDSFAVFKQLRADKDDFI